ncbi:hypothetical protein [Pseudomarimonas salicorniae]|uniref:Uncharacterized protein n=1 Tax=Pseudomarimonas salicorniae TaxID=2933270 RepID=A0ABT0GLR7_9GAMM|nr:hypothetical protein [Lysobacter sp. CAU 1642]MCK7595492.1 hypothetical protein [Lysobacter sp. CAU 1642]
MGRPRHPLARLFLACVAIALLALASVFVMIVAGSVLALWLGRRAWLRLRGESPAAAPRGASGEVLEGEYRVVRRSSELLPR